MSRSAGYVICLLFISCGQRFSADPSFQLTVTASNPRTAFRVSLILRANPINPTQGLLHVAQVGAGNPVYRQPGVVRQRLADTIILADREFETVYDALDQLKAWTGLDSYGERSDGTKYEIEVVERSLQNRYVVMGESNHSHTSVPERILSLFESHYDSIPLAQLSSGVSLTRIGMNGVSDSLVIRVEKSDGRFFFDGVESALSWQEYCELWQTFENFHVWSLSDQMEFARRYPIEYRFGIYLDDRQHRWRVFAPSRLEDTRYFRIVNALEALALKQAREVR